MLPIEGAKTIAMRALRSARNQLSFANNPAAQSCLCRDAFISMVKTRELWKGDNLSLRQHVSGERTIFVEAQVRSGFMVVAEIGSQGSFKMASV